jgi:hypothetical protein
LTGGTAPITQSNRTYLDGYAARFTWGYTATYPQTILDDADGPDYHFENIGTVVTDMASYGKKFTLCIHPFVAPAYVISGAGETYSASIAGADITVPVPWDAAALAAYDAFIHALSVYEVGGVDLNLRPELAGIRVGLFSSKGLDDDGGRLVALGSYTRTKYITDGVLPAIHSVTDHFPGIPVFVEVDPMTDATPSPRLDMATIAAIAAEFDGDPNPQAGLFVESLKASYPLSSGRLGTNLLYGRGLGMWIGMQACGAWINNCSPCSDANCGSSPADGFNNARGNFGAEYLEIYNADTENDAWAGMFESWQNIFNGTMVPGGCTISPSGTGKANFGMEPFP